MKDVCIIRSQKVVFNSLIFFTQCCRPDAALWEWQPLFYHNIGAMLLKRKPCKDDSMVEG